MPTIDSAKEVLTYPRYVRSRAENGIVNKDAHFNHRNRQRDP